MSGFRPEVAQSGERRSIRKQIVCTYKLYGWQGKYETA